MPILPSNSNANLGKTRGILETPRGSPRILDDSRRFHEFCQDSTSFAWPGQIRRGRRGAFRYRLNRSARRLPCGFPGRCSRWPRAAPAATPTTVTGPLGGTSIKTPRAVEVSNLTRRGDASPPPAQSGTVPGVIPAVVARACRQSHKPPVRKLGGDGARTVNLNVLPDPHGQESCDRPWLDAPVARDAVGRRLSMPPSPPAHLQPVRAGKAGVREHGLR
jgi:hypothetical protein